MPGPKPMTTDLPSNDVPKPLAAIGVTQLALPSEAVGPERWLWRALIAVLCMLSYAPSFQGEFLWDDNQHASSARLRSPTALTDIWTSIGSANGGTVQYYPLTHTSFWLEYQLFGVSPVGYRMVNALLHAAAGIMLWELLRRLRVPGAFVGALLWAVHPVNVESVAWVSERKNVLSGLMVLASVMAYLRYAGLDAEHSGELAAKGSNLNPSESSNPLDWPEGDGRLYAASLFLFVLACLSKTVICVAPAAMLVILWWKDRLTSRNILRIAPLLAIGIVAGLATSYMERTLVIRTADAADWGLGQKGRLLIAGSAIWFYLGKLLFPYHQMFFYPYWEIVETMPFGWAAVAGVLATLAGLAFWASRSKSNRAPLAVALLYCGILFPALGFFKIYPQRYSWVADHFQYHASMAMVPALVAAVILLARRFSPFSAARTVGLTSALLVLAIAAGLTWSYSFNFRTNQRLFERVVELNPASWAARNNLGTEYIRNAQYAERVSGQLKREGNTAKAAEAIQESQDWFVRARDQFLQVLALRPNHEWANHGLGEVAYLSGDFKAARENYLLSLQQRKDSPDGEYIPTLQRLADIATRDKQYAEAADYLARAIKAERPPIQQRQYQNRVNFVRVLALLAREDRRQLTLKEAAGSYDLMVSAVTLHPAMDTYIALGDAAKTFADVTRQSGDIAKSEEIYRQALDGYQQAAKIDANNTDALYGLGLTLATIKLYDKAIIPLDQAVRLRPERKDIAELLAMVKDYRQRATTNPALRPTSQPTSVPAP